MKNKLNSKPPTSHTMTLADVISEIKKLPAKTSCQQGHYAEACSALTRICTLAGRTPADVSANLALVEKLLNGINPVLANLTAGGFQNLKSNVRRAFSVVGLSGMKSMQKVKPSPAWQALVGQLPKYSRIKILRFASLCTRTGIAPSAVTEAAFIDFRSEVETCLAAKKAMMVVQGTADAWNHGRVDVPGWPGLTLVRPTNAKPTFVLSLDAFPTSFQHEQGVWLKRVRDADEDDVHAPTKGYRSRTIANYTESTCYAASALVKIGMPLAEIVGLATLLKPTNIDKIIGFIETRLNAQNSATKTNTLLALLSLAKFGPTSCHKFADPIRDRLKKIGKGAGPEQKSMTEKNRQCVMMFSDPATARRLLKTSTVLMRLADAVENPCAVTARQAALAVAIAILFSNPLRAKNLYGLDLDRHFQRVGKGKAEQTFVHIDGNEVKNGVALDFALTKHAAALLLHYLKRYRPILLKAHGQPKNTNYLFPGTQDGHIAYSHASLLIGNATEKYVGVRLTTHQFRHVTAYLVLAAQPGAYELLAKVLGHTSTKVTKQAYTGLEGMQTNLHFQDLVRSAGAFGGPAKKKSINSAYI
jgi:integrase